MQIQINTDHNIEADDRLTAEVDAAVRGTLGHLTSWLTRVEVHLSDQVTVQGGESSGAVPLLTDL